MSQKPKIMDAPNAKAIKIKLNRTQCIRCRAEAYDMPYNSKEGMWDLFDTWWPKNNMFDHVTDGKTPGAGHCPAPIMNSYLRKLRLKAQSILEKSLPAEEFALIGAVRDRAVNYIRCDLEAPLWCPHRKHHANWAKRKNKTIILQD